MLTFSERCCGNLGAALQWCQDLVTVDLFSECFILVYPRGLRRVSMSVSFVSECRREYPWLRTQEQSARENMEVQGNLPIPHGGRLLLSEGLHSQTFKIVMHL